MKGNCAEEMSTIWLPKQDSHNANTSDIPVDEGSLTGLSLDEELQAMDAKKGGTSILWA